MLNLHRAAVLIVSTAFAIGAHAARLTGAPADFGMPVPNDAAERTIAVTPGTRHVNVTDGETIRFDVNGRAFTWHFNTWPTIQQFDLEKIAPKEAQASGITVYVERNPRYYGP